MLIQLKISDKKMVPESDYNHSNIPVSIPWSFSVWMVNNLVKVCWKGGDYLDLMSNWQKFGTLVKWRTLNNIFKNKVYLAFKETNLHSGDPRRNTEGFYLQSPQYNQSSCGAPPQSQFFSVHLFHGLFVCSSVSFLSIPRLEQFKSTCVV